MGGGWSVVVPLKRLAQAELPGYAYRPHSGAPLSWRWLVTFENAVLACDEVAEIIIVTRDPGWHHLLGGPRLRFVAERPTDSLNDALRRGAARMPDLSARMWSCCAHG